MNIDLRIKSISLTGFDLLPRDADQMRDRITEHLSELIAAGGIDPQAAAGLGERVQIRNELRPVDQRPVTLAHEIATAIYGQLGNQKGSRL